MRGGAPAPVMAGTVRFPLANQFWGDRYGQVAGPYDHSWSIAAPVRR